MEDDVKKDGWGEGLREQQRRLERYKYPILVLLLGAALLLIPWGGGETPAEAAPAAGTDLMDPAALEQKLEALPSVTTVSRILVASTATAESTTCSGSSVCS